MKKGLYFWIKSFIVAILIVLLVKTLAFTSCTIPFSGMENSLYQGDRVIVNKWSYGLRLPFSNYHWGSNPVEKNDIVLFNNPFPKSSNTNINDREIYISRCVGLPGDTLMLDNQLCLSSQNISSPDCKFLYAYPQEKEDTLISLMKRLDIANNELMGYNKNGFIRSFSHYEIYLLKQELGGQIQFTALESANDEKVHPLIIPSKGKSIRIYPWNIKLLRNTILQHENKAADIHGDTLLVNGKKVYSYTFTKDYYWMVSNNSINLNDSRLFGLVPKDHIIGKATFIWFSKDPEYNVFKGYRWNRFFQSVK